MGQIDFIIQNSEKKNLCTFLIQGGVGGGGGGHNSYTRKKISVSTAVCTLILSAENMFEKNSRNILIEQTF